METNQSSRLTLESLQQQISQIPIEWRRIWQTPEMTKTTSSTLRHIRNRLAAGAIIYPPTPFRIFQELLPQQVRVVILGQDPYHGPGQAQGISFSVPDDCPRPPSLNMIFTELSRDFSCANTIFHNDLMPWVKQGVFLLNAALTVERGNANSHAQIGWHKITDAVIRYLAQDAIPKVFMLWGNFARAKKKLISSNNSHLVLEANHPSPLSAFRPPIPFIGCGHFSHASHWLEQKDLQPVHWTAF